MPDVRCILRFEEPCPGPGGLPFLGELPIVSYSWTFHNPVPGSYGHTPERVRPTGNDISVSMRPSIVSPLLMHACLTSKPLGHATLTCRHADAPHRPIVVIRLRGVWVTSHSQQFSESWDSNSSGPLIDQFILSFS